MDPSGALATWGNFLTANAANMAGTAAALTDISTDTAGIMAACGATGSPTDTDAVICLTDCAGDTDCNTACIAACAEAAVVAYVMEYNPAILADDSGHDFDGTDGRLTMNFDIPCVPIIEAREVVAEFVEVGENGGCMVESACNYDSTATVDDWTCIYGSNDSAGLEPCYETAGLSLIHI